MGNTGGSGSTMDRLGPSLGITTGMELDADGQTVRRRLFIGAVGVRPRRGSSGSRPSAYTYRRRRGGYAEGSRRRHLGPRRSTGIASGPARAVVARSRRQSDADGHPRHRAWAPYADGHPRHIVFFYFFYFFPSLILLYNMFLLFIY
jgi:hypothetical protein